MERYERYKDSGVKWIGEIPGHWGMYKLKYLFKLNKNKNIGNKCNTILSLSYGKIKIKKDLNEGLTPESYESYQLLSTGDIVIRSTDLQNDHTSLRTGLVKIEGAITSAYIGLKNLDMSLCDSRFYHYFLHDWDITKAIYNQGKGLRQSLNWDDIKNMLIPVLDISEQTAIANYLDSTTAKIDEAIAQQQKMIDLLNERKQIIINNAVTKGLNPDAPMKDSGVDWIGEIPEHWEVMKTSHIFHHIGSGTTPKSGREDYYSEDGIPFLQTGDLNDGFINETSKHITEKALRDTNLKLYPKGSLVVAMYGATIGKLGILNIDTTVNQACCVLPTSDRVGNKFAMHVLSTAKADLFLKSRGRGQPNISQDTIRNEKIVVPPLAEQNEIVQYIEHSCTPIDGAISNATNQISLLEERKQIIINDVVTRKVKVS